MNFPQTTERFIYTWYTVQRHHPPENLPRSTVPKEGYFCTSTDIEREYANFPYDPPQDVPVDQNLENGAEHRYY
jgi:hypothetical protein